MSPTTIWLTVLGVGLGTYALRLSFIVLWQRLRIPPVVHQALGYVPTAVLAALVLPALVRPEGVVDISPDNLRLLAGVLAAAVAWFSRNVLLTLATGMGALWVLEWLQGAW
ncbi:MAG: AzlD domain-containing protein [Halofilum sp. (in: g-proteobacteria)]|nr:AzlD domain-containing protein [Halofilum sp. (in: g-proteobacteria)]